MEEQNPDKIAPAVRRLLEMGPQPRTGKPAEANTEPGPLPRYVKSHRPRPVAARVLSPFAGMVILGSELGGAAIHIWLTIMIYKAGGFFAALFMFCLPFLSEAVLFRRYWVVYGFVGTWFNVACICVVSSFAFWVMLALVIERLDKRAESCALDS